MDKRGKHPNARKTQFKPGESGNPAGRPSIGASTREWFAQMWHMPQAEVAQIKDDESAPAGKRWAAELVLSRQGQDFDRIMDRTEGKPPQTQNVNLDGEIHVMEITLKDEQSSDS